MPCILSNYPECNNFTDIKRIICDLEVKEEWTRDKALDAGKQYLMTHNLINQKSFKAENNMPALNTIERLFGSMAEYQEAEEIEKLKDCIVVAVTPLRVYLFGSFATGTNGEESDYDFYVVVNDDVENIVDITTKAYRALRGLKKRPVDIVVGKKSSFDERKHWKLSLEREVADKGVLLYAS